MGRNKVNVYIIKTFYCFHKECSFLNSVNNHIKQFGSYTNAMQWKEVKL